MRRPFAALLLALGCNGQADLISGSIEGFDTIGVEFAFFGSAEGFGFDLNGNGSSDAAGVVKVILTDREDLCDQLQNPEIIGNFGRLGDATLVILTGVLTEDGSEGPVVSGNDLSFENINNGAGDQLRVDYLAIREGGTQASASNESDDERNGRLNVNNASGFASNGAFAATMFFFDDDAQEERSTEINGFFRAQRCFALDALAVGENL